MVYPTHFLFFVGLQLWFKLVQFPPTINMICTYVVCNISNSVGFVFVLQKSFFIHLLWFVHTLTISNYVALFFVYKEFWFFALVLFCDETKSQTLLLLDLNGRPSSPLGLDYEISRDDFLSVRIQSLSYLTILFHTCKWGRLLLLTCFVFCAIMTQTWLDGARESYTF